MQQAESQEVEKLKAFDADVRKNFRWNFWVNLLYGLFGTTGWRLIMAPTFVPDYMYKLSGSNTVVGLLLFFGGLSRFLTPPLTASLVEHRPFLKKTAILVGSLMRSQVFLMAMAGFLLSGRMNIVAFFIFFSFFNLFLGMQHVVYNTVMSKVIPVDRRGGFMGLRNFLGGVTAALVARAAGSLMERLPFPQSYAATYLFAFALTCIGLVFFAFSREPATPVVLQKTPMLKRLRSLPSMFSEDKNFANYAIASAVGSFSLMANPFFILYVGSKISISGRELGELTFYFFLAQTTVNLFLGRLADHRGFRLVFIISAACWAFTMLALVIAPVSYTLAIWLIVLLGAGVGGFRMSMNNMVLEFGDTAERPMRIAVVNSIAQLANAVGPLIAGFMADMISYKSVFIVSTFCTTAALVVMLTRVTEPRNEVADNTPR